MTYRGNIIKKDKCGDWTHSLNDTHWFYSFKYATQYVDDCIDGLNDGVEYEIGL